MSYTEEKALRVLLTHKLLEEMSSSVMDFAGIFSCPKLGGGSETVIKHYAMRLSRSSAVRLFKDRRSCSSAEVLGILYSLGIGVPRDAFASEFWMHRRLMPSAHDCRLFVMQSEALKQHLSRINAKPSRYLYDEETSALERLHLNPLRQTEAKVPATLIYKRGLAGYTLHNLVVDGDTYIYSLPNVSDVPKTLTVNSTARYLAVTGVLVLAPKREPEPGKGGPEGQGPGSKRVLEGSLPDALRHHLRWFDVEHDLYATKVSKQLVFGMLALHEVGPDYATTPAATATDLEVRPFFRTLRRKQ